MLTDRQFIALQIFQSAIGNWSEVLFVARSKQTETIKTLANSALVYADIFLAESGGNVDIEVIEKEFKNIGIKLEEMNQLNQQLSESNKALLDLVGSDIEGIYENQI